MCLECAQQTSQTLSGNCGYFLTFWADFILSLHDMKVHKMVTAILALLSAVFLWNAFAQTETPCRTACKTKYDACWTEHSKPGADPRIAGAVCGSTYSDCLDACRFAEIGTPKTPCETACKTEFGSCLKQGAGGCGPGYDLCMLKCK